ncbi:MAG TPA: aminodeoxychorismate/anthranilate synthase component II [Gammaproteobacteria bacterium]|nr:aminodeoxychorismate/anthranilate synthase component II [Gammaproteobacteria bacterium]
MILLIDNYDSFVYNLARYVSELGFLPRVVRHDAIQCGDIAKWKPSHIIISPGPGTPSDAGISLDVIRQFGPTIPILGVCLGHQAMGQAYGGKVVRAKHPMHGKASLIQHDEKKLFAGIPNPLRVARYHSLIVSDADFPDALCVTARCERGEIMAISHRDYPVYGVQFHPESVLTTHGHALLKNFLITPRV